jgi:hypothetical protein
MNDISEISSIDKLQDEVSKLPQYEPVTDHYFADGMYCRRVWRPAGVLVVGRVHKKEHFYAITKGKVAIYGMGETRIAVAGEVIVSSPGTKRAVMALEDSVCMTVHRTWTKDLDAIEKELLEDAPESMYTVGNKVKPEALTGVKVIS